MARRRFQLTEDQVNNLTNAYAHCKDGPLRTRYQAVRLYGTGYPVKEVLEITGCSRTSLMEWCQKYLAEGIEGLADKRIGGNRARLSPMQIEALQTRLHTYTPRELFGKSTATVDGQYWTVADLQAAIERCFGVSYRSTSSYHRYFDLCGFSYQRTQKVYKSRSEPKVAEFEDALEKNWLTSPKTPLRR